MAQSYISVQKSVPIIIGYICSGCGNPIISVASINAHTNQYYTFSQTHAQEIAEEKIDEAISFEINRIKSYTSTKECLSYAVNTVSGMHYGSYCESSISSITTPCPNCSSVERWQKAGGQSVGTKNYPTVFDNMESAKIWARGIISTLMQEIDNKRLNNDIISTAKEKCIRLNTENQKLEEQILQIPELCEKQKIEHKKAIAISQQKNLAIFDFKGKKLIKTTIKNFDEQLKKLELIISKKVAEPKKLIESNKLKLQKVQPIAYGYSSEIIVNTVCKTSVFLISSNAIPEEQIDSTNINSSDMLKSNKETEIPQILFCKQCGFKLLPDSDFCSICGSEIRKDDAL